MAVRGGGYRRGGAWVVECRGMSWSYLGLAGPTPQLGGVACLSHMAMSPVRLCGVLSRQPPGRNVQLGFLE